MSLHFCILGQLQHIDTVIHNRCGRAAYVCPWASIAVPLLEITLGVAGLLGLHARLTVSPAVLLEAAALHLDVADEDSPSAVQAWTALAATLSNAAKLLCDLQASCVCLALWSMSPL